MSVRAFCCWTTIVLLLAKSGFVGAQFPPPARTAKVETTEIKTTGESGKGMLRQGMEALVAQCNGIREEAHLPPKYPAPGMLDRLDLVDHVYAYDGVRHRAHQHADGSPDAAR